MPIKKNVFLDDWPHIRRGLYLFLAINIMIGAAGLITMYFNQQQTSRELTEVKAEVKELKKYIYEKSTKQ